MTWNSGPCDPANAGTAFVITDAYPEPVRIDDADVRADEAERVRGDVEQDRELFTRIAETHPGIVRTLSVLISELADVDLEPALLHALGERVQRIGDTVIMRADRVVVDVNNGE